MCTQCAKLKFINPTYGLFETVYVFAIASIVFKRDVLIWRDLNKSFQRINHFDPDSNINGLILSKIFEKLKGRVNISAWLHFGAWDATPSAGQSGDIKTRRYIHLNAEIKSIQ